MEDPQVVVRLTHTITHMLINASVKQAGSDLAHQVLGKSVHKDAILSILNNALNNTEYSLGLYVICKFVLKLIPLFFFCNFNINESFTCGTLIQSQYVQILSFSMFLSFGEGLKKIVEIIPQDNSSYVLLLCTVDSDS